MTSSQFNNENHFIALKGPVQAYLNLGFRRNMNKQCHGWATSPHLITVTCVKMNEWGWKLVTKQPFPDAHTTHKQTRTPKSMQKASLVKDILTIVDKKQAFMHQQTVSGRFACLSPYTASQPHVVRFFARTSFLDRESKHKTQQQCVSEIPRIPWKVWTFRRSCVLKKRKKKLKLNSSTVSHRL